MVSKVLHYDPNVLNQENEGGKATLSAHGDKRQQPAVVVKMVGTLVVFVHLYLKISLYMKIL